MHKLSPKECECLAALASGVHVKRIPEKLGITQATYHTYLARARLKLGAVNSCHAVALFVKGAGLE